MNLQKKQQLLRYGDKSNPFWRHNHMELVDVDDGVATMQLIAHSDSANRWGTIHGGAIFSLGDAACSMAVTTLREEKCVIVNANINFLRPGKDCVKAIGRVERMGGKLTFCKAELYDAGGELIAQMHAVMSFTGEKIVIE